MYVVKEYFCQKNEKCKKDEFAGCSLCRSLEEAIDLHQIINTSNQGVYSKVFEIDFDDNGIIYDRRLTDSEYFEMLRYELNLQRVTLIKEDD